MAVMDGEEFTIKWAVKGLTRSQHDANFLENGQIMVFDNHYNVSSSTMRSRVVTYSMKRMGPIWNYTSPDFFSDLRGSQQKLPNGNVLITEANAGTLLEVTENGRVVWKYQSTNQANKIFGQGKYIGYLQWAHRYPKDYFNEDFRGDFDRAANDD